MNDTRIHQWKFYYCHPHNGEYWYKCEKCGAADWISRADHLAENLSLLTAPPTNLCSDMVKAGPQVSKADNPWKQAVLKAMKSYNMDISHYEKRPDDAVCDLLYMHTNAEVHRAMMNHYTNEGDQKG